MHERVEVLLRKNVDLTRDRTEYSDRYVIDI